MFNDFIAKIKDSFFYFGAAIVKLPIAIFTSPLFAKNLSASDFAAIGYFNALSTFLMPIVALSFYSYYMTVYHSNTKEENKEVLRTLVSFLLIVDVFVVGIAFYILKFYLEYSGSNFNAYPLGLIVFTTAMFNMAIGFWGIELRFEGKSVKYFILQTGVIILSVGLGLLFVVKYQMGATGRLLPNMFVNILLFILFYSLFVKKYKINKDILKKALHFSLPLVISGLLSLPIIYIDKIFLERLHNDTELGLFVIAGAIAGYYGMVTTALYQAFEPDIFKYVSQGKKKQLMLLLSALIFLFTLGGIIFSIIAPYAVDYLTAGRYIASIKYVNPIIITVILLPVTYFFSHILTAMKYTRISIFNNIIIAFISFVGYYYMITNFTYFGAIYAKILIFIMILSILGAEIYYRKSKFMMKFKVTSA